MIITKMLTITAANHSNKVGFVDDDKSFTYKELDYRSQRVKTSLKKLGVKKGDRVAVLMLNRYHYLELTFGVTAMGGIIVPLNTRLNIKELEYILKDSGAGTLILDNEFEKYLPLLKEEVKSLKTIISLNPTESADHQKVVDYDELFSGVLEERLIADDVEEDDIAGVFYTSGTTGNPKGVILTHKNLVNDVYNFIILGHRSESEVWLHAAPLYHIGSFSSLLGYTCIGGKQVALHNFSTKEVLELVEKEKVTSAFFVPTMVNMLLNDSDFEHYEVSSLSQIAYGASPMPVELLRKTKKIMPNIEFAQGYGSTETASAVIALTPEHHKVDGNEKEQKRLESCGQPVPMMEIKVVDSTDEEVPIGEVGEIIAKGPQIMKGYWNLPEETNKSIRNGWYYTGDMGYRDEDNFYYIVDRAKDMIISGGENVYSIEVEDALYKHPRILECAVIGVPDEKWGEAVKALIVTKQEEELREEEIQNFLRQYIANYKVPKEIEFLSELPRTGSGKVQKHVLREKYWGQRTKKVN